MYAFKSMLMDEDLIWQILDYLMGILLIGSKLVGNIVNHEQALSLY